MLYKENLHVILLFGHAEVGIALFQGQAVC